MFCGPLLPVLRERLGLTLAMSATLGTWFLIIHNYAQPLLGLMGERYGPRNLLVLGMLLSAAGMSGLGLATSYGWALFALTVGGVGIGLFHPCGAAIAGNVTRRNSLAVTLYMLGGNVGIMVAPAVVATLAARDLRQIVPLVLPGLLVAVVLWRWLRYDAPKLDRATPMDRAGFLEAAKALGWIHLRVVLRFVPPAGCAHVPAALLHHARLHRAAGGHDPLFRPAMQQLRRAHRRRVDRAAAAPGNHDRLGSGRGGVSAGRAVGAGRALLSRHRHGAVPGLCRVPLADHHGAGGRAAHQGKPRPALVMGFAYGNASLLLIPLNALAAAVAVRTGSEFRGLSLELQIAATGFFISAGIAALMPLRNRRAVSG